jgi:hypothetical protein
MGYIILRGGTQKFRRLRLLVFSIKVFWKESYVLGSGEGKALESGLCYKQRKEMGYRQYCISSELDINNRTKC